MKNYKEIVFNPGKYRAFDILEAVVIGEISQAGTVGDSISEQLDLLRNKTFDGKGRELIDTFRARLELKNALFHPLHSEVVKKEFEDLVYKLGYTKIVDKIKLETSNANRLQEIYKEKDELMFKLKQLEAEEFDIINTTPKQVYVPGEKKYDFQKFEDNINGKI